MKLKAEQHYSCDWVVYDDDTYDGPGSTIGWGRTPKDAIMCFLDSMPSDPLGALLAEAARRIP